MTDPPDSPAGPPSPRGSVPPAGSAPPPAAKPPPDTAAPPPAPGTAFTVGGVLSQTFTTLGRNLIAGWFLGALAMAITYAPLILFDTATFGVVAETRPDLVWVGFGAYLTFYFVFGNLAVAAISYLTFQDLRQRRRSAIDSMLRGLAVMLPVVGIAIVTALATLLGTLLLVIPGLIVMTVLWVAVPAAVVERLGVSASLKRSADLTRGNRWRVFGIILVIGIASSFTSWVTEQVVAAVSSVGENSPTMLAAAALVDGFFAALAAIAATVGYRDLRFAREGGDIDQIAAIFD